MREAFRFFVSNHRFTNFSMIIVVVWGILGLLSLKRESFPPVNFARVQVLTYYPGASAQEVDERVTRKIEDELRKVTGIKDTTSLSQAGRSEIDVRIDMDAYDVQEVTDEIYRAAQAAQDLPPDLLSDPKVIEIKAEEIPIFEFALLGGDERARYDSALRLRRQLEDLKAVASVSMQGYRKREYQVRLDPAAIRRGIVGIGEVYDALGKRVNDIPAGFIRQNSTLEQVRLVGKSSDVQELADIVLRSNEGGRTLRLRDVGRVVEASEDPTTLVSYNGAPAVLFTITKKGTSDIIDTVRDVRASLDRFSAELPEGYKIAVYNDESVRVQDRLDIVVGNAWQGLILVLIVLFAFLPGSVGVMSALTLPICVAGTVAFMQLAGANFNIITMLGLIIALGMIVDNSVVVAETYATFRKEGLSPSDAAVQSVARFWVPISASALTTVAAFVPMLVTKGVMGQFIKWIPVVVSAALLLSLVESLFFLPARLQFVLRRDNPGESAPGRVSSFFTRLRERFEELVRLSVRRRYLAFFVLLGVFAGGVGVNAVGNRFELFPAEGVEFFYARAELPAGTNIYRTKKELEELSRRIREALGEEIALHVLGTAGASQTYPDDPLRKTGENLGIVRITIPRDYALKTNPAVVLEKLRTIRQDTLTSLSFEAESGGPPVGKPLTLVLRDFDYARLRAASDSVLAYVRGLPGVVSPQDNDQTAGPEYRFKPDHARLKLAGLDFTNLGLSVRNALQGGIVTTLFEGGEEYDLRVRLEHGEQGVLESLTRLELANSSGNLVPISRVADIEKSEAPRERRNFDYKRAITVTADVDNDKMTSVELNARVRAELPRLLSDYPGVSYVFGGEDESTQESVQSLFQALIIALLVIFAILVFILSSFSKSILVLTTIPLGLIGVLYAFFLHQRPLSFLALIGVVGLMGVVVNSAIILIDTIEFLKKRAAPGESLENVLVTASGDRLRPILVTSITTIGGLVPTAYKFGGFDPLLVPMTLALAWGLTSATLLTLFWIPAGYAMLEDVRSRWSRKPKAL
jgi:multidrug efflux pump subunit AcrB